MSWDNLSAAEVARALMDDSVDNVFVVSPIVTRADVERPYFMVATKDPDGFCAARIEVDGGNDDRSEVIAAIAVLASERGTVSIHTVDDELEAARLCARLWPGPQTEELRRGAEQERARSLS